jgi:hypothetical protein
MTSNVIMNAIKYMPKEATLMQAEEAITKYKAAPNDNTEEFLFTSMMIHVIKVAETHPQLKELLKEHGLH